MPYLGKEPVRGQNRELDDISGSFNGGNTAFTMQVGGVNTAAGSANQVFISLGGVMQNPGTDFTVASSTLTFTTPPASGLDFWGIIQGDAVDINTPADGSVTAAKLASGAGITVLTGSTNNTITTVTGAGAIQGEANLTFDGSDLIVVGEAQIGNTSNHTKFLRFADATRVDASTIKVDNSNSNLLITNNRGTGEIQFACNSAERVSIDTSGHLTITDGNLIIGTAGHGIDFSAQTALGGMTAELLDHYEEGTWTPSFNALSTGSVSVTSAGYTKVGRLVHVQGYITVNSTSSNNFEMSMPFQMVGGSQYAPITTQIGANTTASHLRLNTGSTQAFCRNQVNGDSIRTYANLNGGLVIFAGTYMAA